MDKIYWNDLGIEVTRKCNMYCAHCMRGAPQNLDINMEWVDEVLKNTAFIGNIHFAGGEPSLNPKAILEILDIIKKYKIPVMSYNTIINGKFVSDKFIQAIIEWDKYCKKFSFKKNLCVALTIDEFHEDIQSKNIQKLLKKLPSFGIKIDNFKNGTKTIADIGNARKLFGYKKAPQTPFPYKIYKYNNNFYIISHFVLTCAGNIIKNSDYEFTDEKSIIFSKYNNLIETIKEQKNIITLTNNDFLSAVINT